MSRVVAWWSAGAASTVAAKLAGPDVVAYCDTSASEHPDNLRFLADCEAWFGRPIVRLRSETYSDIWDVFRKIRWLVGPGGARCTTELKKKVRREFQRSDDVRVFGFTLEERARAERFRANNPECQVSFPLIEAAMTHADCLALVRAEGLRLPAMYELGYRNNNCIGCVKGGMGYWNKIRRDFPDVFARMAAVEREIGASILRERNGDRLFLDTLAPDRGTYAAEPEIECGVACEAARRGEPR